MQESVCSKCGTRLSEDTTNSDCPQLEMISRKLETASCLLIELEPNKLYIGITKTPEGYVVDAHNGDELIISPEGNQFTWTLWEEDYNSDFGEGEDD